MTTRTWNGATDAFSNGNDWSPAGIPTSGDVAIINSGTVTATGNDLTGNLAVQVTSGAATTILVLADTTNQASSMISTSANGAANLTLGIQGNVQNTGVANFLASGSGNNIIGFLDPASGSSVLTNTGVLGFDTSISQMRNFGQQNNSLVNNGVLALYDSTPGTTKLVYDTVPVSGTGVIRVGAGYTFQSTSTISGQNIYLQAANGVGANVEFDNAVGNTSVISNFTASDQIILTTQPFNATGIATSNGNTVVNFSNNGTIVGLFTLQGTYAANQINISSFTSSSGAIENFIKTSVADTTITGAVYRFFDKNTGTHFFTSDAGEKNNVVANLPNYVEETNGFGNVVQTDPNSQAVFRFFDTKYGTHFFTASTTERDQVIATRSDLTYEPGSTFYENTVNIPGDSAVYRFFDSKFGTHFYTGDQNEFKGITTPGTSTYRADLTYEGVSFYAPKGQFA